MLCAASLLAIAAPAHAACESRPGGSFQTVGNSTTLVHYRAPATRSDADLLLTTLTDARAFERDTLRMGEPPGDGSCGSDARLDAYVFDLGPSAGEAKGVATADSMPSSGGSSSWIGLKPEAARDRVIPSHELMHVLQNAIDPHSVGAINEATAEYAAARFTQTKRPALFEESPWQSLDCTDACSYGQWPFYEHLASRFGEQIIRDIHERIPARRKVADAIEDALAKAGGSLAAEVSLYAAHTLTGTFSFAPLAGAKAAATNTIVLGSSDPPSLHIPVDHLSFRVVQLVREPAMACATVPLTVTAELPDPGVSVPAIALDAAPPDPLAVKGTVATWQSTWNTCSSSARLAVPNGGRRDSAPFTISVSLARPGASRRALRSAKRPALRLLAGRTARLKGNMLRFKVEVLHSGTLGVSLGTRPKIKAVFLLKAGRMAVTLPVPRSVRLAAKGNRLRVTFTEFNSSKRHSASARIKLRR